MTCARSDDSDQPGHLPSLIRVDPGHQARMQTFEKGGANFRYFMQGGANLKKIPVLRPKLGL